MRINKYLAGCNLGSRRKVENLVLEQKVSINGKIVTNLATDVNISDLVVVAGNKVTYNNQFVYIVFHKPKGCVCTLSDDKNRKTVMDFLPDNLKKVVKPVGRLDYNSEGLLLLTNDGDFANSDTSPKSNVQKKYVANIFGEVTADDIKELTTGITSEGETLKADNIKLIKFDGKTSRVEIILSEGKNREIRRLFDYLHKPVDYLKRVQIGELKLGGLTYSNFKEIDKKTADKALSKMH